MGITRRTAVQALFANFFYALALVIPGVLFTDVLLSAVGVSDPAAANRDLTAEVDALRSEQARLEGQRRQLVEAGRDTRAIDARLGDIRAERAAMDLATGAKDVYDEGALNFPCVRVQRDYGARPRPAPATGDSPSRQTPT